MNTPDTERTLLDPTQPTHTGNLYGGKVIYKHTPDTEWEKEFDKNYNQVTLWNGLGYGNIHTKLKSFIIRTCVAEWNKGFEKGRSEYLDKAKDIDKAITSRDTYWKERVRKDVEGMRKKEPEERVKREEEERIAKAEREKKEAEDAEKERLANKKYQDFLGLNKYNEKTDIIVEGKKIYRFVAEYIE